MEPIWSQSEPKSVILSEPSGTSSLKRANKKYYPSRFKNQISGLGFLPFVSNFFSENILFFNFVKARLTGLASRKFLFLPKSKILNSQEKNIDENWSGSSNNFCWPSLNTKPLKTEKIQFSLRFSFKRNTLETS